MPLLPLSVLAEAPSAIDTLASWNDGAAKQAIIDFVKARRTNRLPANYNLDQVMQQIREMKTSSHAGE